MIYFNFRKAFDCVPHLKFLQKLGQLGIPGWIHSWIQCFLTKRALRVKVGEGYSKLIEVTSGVPQGPVLFLVYINECLNGLSCYVAMFADDVKISESPSDAPSLQNDINLLSTWPQRALMSFNTDKCFVLRLHPQQAKDSNPQYQLNGERLRRASHQRDFGVIVDETLQPNRKLII